MIALEQLLQRALLTHRSRLAVVEPGRTATFADVGLRARRLANALLGLTSGPGARVCVLTGNRLEFIEVEVALVLAGMVKAPINPRLVDGERRFVMENVAAEVLITTAAEARRLADTAGDLDALRAVIVIGDDVPPGMLAYDQVLADARATWPVIPDDPAAASVILHTSGTTGRPRGATASRRSRLAALRNMLIDEYACGPDDGMVHVAPVEHGSGSKILTYLLRGGRNILLPRFEPLDLWRAVTELGGTSTFVVPTMIRMLLDADVAGSATGELRNITYGGAPIAPATLEEALDVFGPVFTQVYGACEAPHPVSVLSKADHVTDGAAAHLASAGRPCSGCDVRVVDAERANLATGELGEIEVCGDNVMTGYWNDPAATAEAIVDGWYRTGDVGRFDADGYLYVVDRKKDMIISGGLNVYPAEVEAALLRHADVRECSVVGVPDDLWGERVVAVIVPSRRLADEVPATEAIVQHCAQLLAGYKKPRDIVFVDSLPKGATGKVLKRDLREQIAAGLTG